MLRRSLLAAALPDPPPSNHQALLTASESRQHLFDLAICAEVLDQSADGDIIGVPSLFERLFLVDDFT